MFSFNANPKEYRGSTTEPNTPESDAAAPSSSTSQRDLFARLIPINALARAALERARDKGDEHH